MNFADTVAGKNLLNQLPQAFKNLSVIADSLSVLAEESKKKTKADAPDTIRQIDEFCLICPFADEQTCNSCPLTAYVTLKNLNDEIAERYPDCLVVPFTENGTVKYFWANKETSGEKFDTMEEAYVDLKKNQARSFIG